MGAGQPGSDDGINDGVLIGLCHWQHGCNTGFCTFMDENRNGEPDYFVEAVWRNYDYGTDHDEDGCFDTVTYKSNFFRHTVERNCGNSHRLYKGGCNPVPSGPGGFCTGPPSCGNHQRQLQFSRLI